MTAKFACNPVEIWTVVKTFVNVDALEESLKTHNKFSGFVGRSKR